MRTADELKAYKRAHYHANKAEYAARNATWYAAPANRRRHLRRRKAAYWSNLDYEQTRQRLRYLRSKLKRGRA